MVRLGNCLYAGPVMPTPLGHLRARFRRVMMVLAAFLLVSAPNLMVSANASVMAQRLAIADFSMLMDDTPDVGPVNDAPPPMIGAVNLFFVGVLPGDQGQDFSPSKLGRVPWSRCACALLRSCRLNSLERPPRA